ncbi:uncharacterized protein EDB91DRAFT_1257104 [Suillus paluster]|uniref:uncharacterized protein n=1 Tax=Suillus paluster TaxID=48578 RepID=UPI001B86D144|nr:uncharacterized protein EDB91DRAFT_1257104 [Suillus paluster]KAG1720187.1 hypothetical protein EDB91DRAFT_1257104 [Suillus paluster]
MPVVVSDDKFTSVHIVSRLRRTVTLSSQLTDANNNATPEISIHRNKPPPSAITQKPAQLISKRAADDVGSLSADECAPDEGAMEDGPHESKHLRRAVANDHADMSFDVLTGILFNATACTSNVLDRHRIHGTCRNAHRQVQTFDASSVNAHTFVGTLNSEGFKCINDTHTTVSDPSSAMRGRVQSGAMDHNILLEDIDVQDISTTMKARQEDKTMDVSAFFGAPYAAKSKDGKTRNVRDCKSCHKKGLPHQIDAYCKWCKANKFESMLPPDVKERKNAAAVVNAQQGSLDPHLHKVQPCEHVLPYSDKLFREAAIEWLASTNQPIQAVDHPSFKKMIDTASRATTGVLIPNRKAMQSKIVSIFKQQMTRLKEWLNSKAATGVVNLTCDAWQAANVEAYFA